ncbi:pirin family protein [Smaragdicoccus niigatensis]|uniref:pirin family protein n=1 Tax=Smaragdicoccus niigatensis TaxID=359359 RepID=UPI000367D78A|nr:pirin family protein [Smaragdicoccus niigatensis]
MLAEAIKVVRGNDRIHWWNEWLDSRQSFPATGNFDLEANAHGLLLIHNEDRVDPGEGFDSHQHQNMEIITWVLEGTVVHQDSMGHSGLIHPGLAQRMSAGTGIRHSEKNGSLRAQGESLRVVQMWIPPDELGRTPSYEQLDISSELASNRLVTLASGMPKHDSAIRIGNRFAALHVARLEPGQSVDVPDALFGHVFVSRGAVDFESVGGLHAGDAVRLTSSGGQNITSTESAEVMVWEMHAGLR